MKNLKQEKPDQLETGLIYEDLEYDKLNQLDDQSNSKENLKQEKLDQMATIYIKFRKDHD